MARGKIDWQPVSGDAFALARDPAAAELLEQWTWYEMDPRRKGEKWEESIERTLSAIEALSEHFCKEGIAVCLSLFGSFLLDEILGVAYLLINTKDGRRFYLPSVESSVGTPSFVQTGFNIENRPGSLRKLFEEHAGLPYRILPAGPHVSLVFVPEEDFMEVGRGGCIASASLSGSRLREPERIVLTKALYLILPNRDFDFLRVGVRKERASEVENLLRKLWLPDKPR